MKIKITMVSLQKKGFDRVQGLAAVRAESDDVVATCAGGDACGVIIGVRIGLGACRLEYLRVRRWLACLRRPVAPGAAIPSL